MKHSHCLLMMLLLGAGVPVFSQKGLNEFERTRVTGFLDSVQSVQLADNLEKEDKTALGSIMESIKVLSLYGNLNDSVQAKWRAGFTDAYNDIQGGKNAAIIAVYRKFIKTTGTVSLGVDFETMVTKVFHKAAYSDSLSSYLLATKKIYIVFIDLDSAYYANISKDKDKALFNTTLKINYKTSFFKQSLKDLRTFVGSMGGSNVANKVMFTVVELDSKRVKDPCDVVLSNKSFKEDLTFTIHEKNMASFQVGVVNNKYAVNDFAISGNNLVVTPSADEKENWKSNLYAVLEMHLPRDIDNFQPIWKAAFGANPYEDHKSGTFLHGWLYNVTLDRIGVYGGLKIAKDPLSNLYAGFNYAITKELYINLGWSWQNEITPQVTSIGSITSIEDAKQYAKRKYGSPKFNWGLSFSPSAVITMFK